MRKIRLTESQLIDLIKKSVNKVKTINESRIINEVSYISPESLANLAKMLKKNMEGSGWFGNVTSDSLKKAYHNIRCRTWRGGRGALRARRRGLFLNGREFSPRSRRAAAPWTNTRVTWSYGRGIQPCLQVSSCLHEFQIIKFIFNIVLVFVAVIVISTVWYW